MTYALTTAELHLGDPHWLPAAGAILLVALSALAWGYVQAWRGRRGLLLPLVLKAFGLILLAAFLLDPLWSTQKASPRANLFITLIDNSRSLQVTESDSQRTRADDLKRALGVRDSKEHTATDVPPAKWALNLAENFDARSYAFDTRLHSIETFDELTFDGRGTALVTSLRAIAERFHGRPVAGVLLITDGNATDIPTGSLDLAGLPPIYPVIVGNSELPADLGIAKLTITQSPFEDAPVTVMADVSAIGFEGKTVVAQLIDEEGKVVKAEAMKVDTSDKTLAFRLQHKPAKQGVSFYRLRVMEQSRVKDDATADSIAEGEATAANNERLLVVDRGTGPYRVLYVSGRPNFEFKFLNRAIAEDAQMQLVGLIRIARREAKFAYRDNVVDRTNPLFRGFDGKNDAVEDFDEPVIVRLNTLDDAELRGGFPKSAEELFKFHAIVLDDVEAGFFSRDQLALIEKFVTDRRGGLLMLGGLESLREGEYAGTPIGRMLPVYLDRAIEEPVDRIHRIELTRPGWHEQWLRLRSTEAEERTRLAEMPVFWTINTVTGIKPGATVLAEAVDESGTRRPAVITQSFGGRVAVMAIADWWRWAIKRELDNDDVFKMWRQTARWLVADVPQRVQASAEPVRRDAESPLKLSVRVRDKAFTAMDNAVVTIEVKGEGTEERRDEGTKGSDSELHTPHPTPHTPAITLRAEPSLTEPGLYEAVYLPRGDGAYRASVMAVDTDGKAIGKSELGWIAGGDAEEFQSLRPNRALLDSIAKQTGGQVVALADLESFVSDLPSKKSPMMETVIQPLWHSWWWLALALACFVGEWGLRRIRGLP
ncbi:MAG: hypothetical protein WD768_12380 [Phycisphaeraceae bacterium]